MQMYRFCAIAINDCIVNTRVIVRQSNTSYTYMCFYFIFQVLITGAISRILQHFFLIHTLIHRFVQIFEKLLYLIVKTTGSVFFLPFALFSVSIFNSCFIPLSFSTCQKYCKYPQTLNG